MPDSLLFDGTNNDDRQFTAGSLAGNGAMSVAAIIKPTSLAAGTHFLVNWNANTSAGLKFDLAVFGVWDGTNSRSGPSLVAGEWWVVGFSKATGTVTPRYHTYRYSTSTWAHGTFSGTVVNFPLLTTFCWAFGSSENFPGNILIGGGWDSELSDGTFETLEWFQADWVTAAPDEAWRFDTTGTITPFVGTSTQSSAGNETLDVGDAPVDWEVGPPPPPATDLIARPLFPDFPKMKLRTTV